MQNLIPDITSNTPNYWCTWSLQNYLFGQGVQNFNVAELEGSRGAQHARNNLTEEILFGYNGWVTTLYEEKRKDLFVLLDDGWDLPKLEIPKLKSKETNPFRDKIIEFLNVLQISKYLSSFYLHSDRFPSGKGEPEERLKNMNDKFKELGWKGMAVWVAAQEALKFKNFFDFKGKKYWRQRAIWSKFAGINYWKVDWGLKMHNKRFRKFLTSIGKEYGIEVEHAYPQGPFNDKFGEGLTSHKYVSDALTLLKFSDVYRIYDVSPQLSVPTTLDRIAKILVNSREKGTGRQLINCEDEVYVGAALGCAIGVMRHPYRGLRLRNGKELDFAMPEPRNSKFRMDEVVRAINWHRIAPPFASSAVETQISDEILYDEWLFKSGDFWDKSILNKTIKQGAPAVVARGITPPIINSKKLKPWIITSRNPNGAVSIATLGRMINQEEFMTPRADITLLLKKSDDLIGIFGYYKSLTLHYDSPKSITKIWIQDLKDDKATEVTHEIELNKNKIVLSGEIIEKIGLKKASKNDVSDPGLVLKIT